MPATNTTPVEESKAIHQYLKETTPNPTAFTIVYRQGAMPHCEKGFMHQGDLKSAITRARTHCERMGYTFKFCRPLIVDLDEEEAINKAT